MYCMRLSINRRNGNRLLVRRVYNSKQKSTGHEPSPPSSPPPRCCEKKKRTKTTFCISPVYASSLEKMHFFPRKRIYTNDGVNITRSPQDTQHNNNPFFFSKTTSRLFPSKTPHHLNPPPHHTRRAQT